MVFSGDSYNNEVDIWICSDVFGWIICFDSSWVEFVKGDGFLSWFGWVVVNGDNFVWWEFFESFEVLDILFVSSEYGWVFGGKVDDIDVDRSYFDLRNEIEFVWDVLVFDWVCCLGGLMCVFWFFFF